MAIRRGTERQDSLIGTSGADELYALGGNDRIYAQGGDDRLFGGTGNDGLYASTGNDVVYGGDGIDALFGETGNDLLFGESGDDYLMGNTGDDTIYGGLGNDRLRGNEGNDALFGEQGNDDLQGGTGLNNLYGGDGDDTLHLVDRPVAGVPVARNGTFDGGTGYDVMSVDVRGAFRDPVWTDETFNYVEIYQYADGTGSVLYTTGPEEGSPIGEGSHSGIEEFRLVAESNALIFFGGADAKVTGGNNADQLEGFTGSQDFTGGSGDDDFLFLFRPGQNSGNDVIRDFSLIQGDDIRFNTLVENDTTPDPFSVAVTEIGGNTVYSVTEIETGATAGTVTVLGAVGLPMPDYYLIT